LHAFIAAEFDESPSVHLSNSTGRVRLLREL
jgi:hypothetical protein